MHVNDFSDYYTQLAIQGPKAEATLRKLTSTDLSGIKNYWFTWGQVCGCHNVMIARTGYTGEDGFEIYIPSDEPTSGRVWGEVLAAGAEFGIVPCGLGSRNTLRLEAAMALYGHEISDSINVFEAGLGPLLQAGERHGVRGRGGAAAGAGVRRTEAEAGGPGDGGAGHRARRLYGMRAHGREDWRDYERVARTLFEEEYSVGIRGSGALP